MTPIPSSPVQSQRGTDERERLIALVDQVGDACDWIPHAEQLWAAADMLRADAEQLRARDEEIAGLRKAVTLARNTFEGYAALHREKGTPDGDAKAALNQDLSARMNAALQEKQT